MGVLETCAPWCKTAQQPGGCSMLTSALDLGKVLHGAPFMNPSASKLHRLSLWFCCLSLFTTRSGVCSSLHCIAMPMQANRRKHSFSAGLWLGCTQERL
eukprot:2448408-Amphidinium_carterae.1